MATIKFSRKEIEKHIGKITDEMKEKISMFGTHFENADNENVELEIMPNRPDLYSLQGLLRALKAFIGKETGLKTYNISKPEKNFEVNVDASVKEIRPFTACAIVKKLKFNDDKIGEIIDIQEKIHATLGRKRKKIAVGIYPLEKITLPIRFEARKPEDIKFIPLEMNREMNGLQILQSHPTGREYAHLLEGMEKFPVFVDAKNEILSMPPIINSHITGKITESTKEIFIECSGFDFTILKKTLNILVTMLAEMGGEVRQMQLNYGKDKILTPELTPDTMKLSTENVNKLLGLKLSEAEIKNLLAKMGYNYNPSTKITEIPAWRTDIMHEVDLIEDIAIAYGYSNFKPEIPGIATAGEMNKTEILKKKISDILAGMNMLEISTFYLLTKDDAKLFGLKEKDSIEVEDSKSEYKILKPNLMVSNLKVLKQNVDAEYPQRIFELSKSFSRDKTGKSETGIKETEKLCITLASPNAGFTEIKQTIEYLMRMLGKHKTDYTLESAQASANEFFIDGRCAHLKIGNKTAGYFGEIKPQILESLSVKMPIAGLEIDVEALM